MRGLDGNYMNTQGDASARLQVAYAAEQNIQQARAQAEAMDTLRKLREEVQEPRQSGSSSRPKDIKDYREGEAGGNFNRRPDGKGRERLFVNETQAEATRKGISDSPSHIDIKV